MQAASLDYITHQAKYIITHRDSTLDAVALQSSTVLTATNISRSIAYFDGLGQERRNSITNALELRLSCINPSISLWCGH